MIIDIKKSKMKNYYRFIDVIVFYNYVDYYKLKLLNFIVFLYLRVFWNY